MLAAQTLMHIGLPFSRVMRRIREAVQKKPAWYLARDRFKASPLYP